jgi:hypothetical protein
MTRIVRSRRDCPSLCQSRLMWSWREPHDSLWNKRLDGTLLHKTDLIKLRQPGRSYQSRRPSLAIVKALQNYPLQVKAVKRKWLISFNVQLTTVRRHWVVRINSSHSVRLMFKSRPRDRLDIVRFSVPFLRPTRQIQAYYQYYSTNASFHNTYNLLSANNFCIRRYVIWDRVLLNKSE